MLGLLLFFVQAANSPERPFRMLAIVETLRIGSRLGRDVK